MTDFDIVIRDGIVVDGTGAQRYRADVGIRGGRIATHRAARASDGARVLDAERHDRRAGLRRPAHPLRRAALLGSVPARSPGWHGVTSVVIGNCGFGFAPMRPGDARARDARP